MKLGLRFDLDTVACYRQGLDPLRRVLDLHKVRATFAVNAGRSIAYRYLFRRGGGGPAKFSTRRRLGLAGITETLLTNPRLGRRFHAQVDALYRDGHEIAVHGGRNHARWQYGLDGMSEEEIRADIEWGIGELADYAPTGFVAPGHVGNPSSKRLVAERFAWSSYTRPANIVGPQGIPIIEYLLAQNWSSGAIVHHVAKMIRDADHPILYGHPCVEGMFPHIIGFLIAEARA